MAADAGPGAERQDIGPQRREVKHVDHPDVGPLTLTFQAFDVRSAPRQQLIAYQAEPSRAVRASSA